MPAPDPKNPDPKTPDPKKPTGETPSPHTFDPPHTVVPAPHLSDPTDGGHAKGPPDRRFRIMHTGVGRFREGEFVTAKQFGEGCDLDRLIGLGAIAEVPPGSEPQDVADAGPAPVALPGGLTPMPSPVSKSTGG